MLSQLLIVYNPGTVQLLYDPVGALVDETYYLQAPNLSWFQITVAGGTGVVTIQATGVQLNPVLFMVNGTDGRLWQAAVDNGGTLSWTAQAALATFAGNLFWALGMFNAGFWATNYWAPGGFGGVVVPPSFNAPQTQLFTLQAGSVPSGPSGAGQPISIQSNVS